jgi:signal transduction histidine kinase
VGPPALANPLRAVSIIVAIFFSALACERIGAVFIRTPLFERSASHWVQSQAQLDSRDVLNRWVAAADSSGLFDSKSLLAVFCQEGLPITFFPPKSEVTQDVCNSRLVLARVPIPGLTQESQVILLGHQPIDWRTVLALSLSFGFLVLGAQKLIGIRERKIDLLSQMIIHEAKRDGFVVSEHFSQLSLAQLKRVVDVLSKARSLKSPRSDLEVTQNFAHDLRSPLLLLKSALADSHSPEAGQMLELAVNRIQENCDRYLAQLRDQAQWRSLNDLLHGVAAEVQSQLPAIRVETQVHSNSGWFLWEADAAPLCNHLSNLVQNSVDAIKTQGDQVEPPYLKLQAQQLSNGLLEFLVEDNGPGFGHFNKTHSSHGLGLSGAEAWASTHQGELRVSRSKSRRTQVLLRVRLPLRTRIS